MKFYNSVGPNPQVVRRFMAERGIDIPIEEVDLMGGANRAEPYLKTNPAGQMPALELDDGSVVTEITAICEYLDETQPGESLIGDTPEERAQTRRWTRWVDLNIVEPMSNGFRFSEGLELFRNRMRVLPEAADGLKACAQDKLAWLDRQLAERDYVAGDRFTLADVLLHSFISFGERVGQPLDRKLKNIAERYDRVGERESMRA